MSATTTTDISKTNSQDLLDLKISINITRDFLTMVELLDTLPDMSKVPYDVTRSLYQAVSKGRDIQTLGKELEGFFGSPKKPAGKPMPVTLRLNPSIKYLRGIREEQALFMKKTKNGFFYGALWPWTKVPDNITVHLGYCGNKMSNKDFENLEKLAKTRALNENVFNELESGESRVNGISLPSFLQMAELEKMTCTLEVKAGKSNGSLYLRNGELIDAATGNLRNRAAAYRIISWDDTEIEILDAGEKDQNKINQALMEILVEALRLRTLRAQQTQPKEIISEAKPSPVTGSAASRRRKSAEAITNDRYDALKEAAQESKSGPWKPILAFSLCTVLLLILGGKFALHVLEARTHKTNFEQLMAEVNQEEDLIRQHEMLTAYYESSAKSEYSDQVEKEIEAIQSQIEEQDFSILVAEVDQLPVDENYEAIAKELFEGYIDKYPIGLHTAEIQDRLASIPQLIDDVDYKKLEHAVRLDYDNRIEAYLGYLLKHPNGRYKRKVETFISEMSDEYYRLLMQKTVQCDQVQNWDSCLTLCNNFLSYFSRDYRAEEIEYIKWELEDKKAFNKLLTKVSKVGDNYLDAKKILVDYLEQNPDTANIKKIKNDISRLQQRISRLSEWEKVAAFSQNKEFNVAERINYLQMYLQQNPMGPFLGEANAILNRLQTQYRYDRQQYAEAVQKKRQAIAQQEKARLENELKNMMAQVEQSGGRYLVNGDGTFTDTQTSLVWALLDSRAELGGCQDFTSASKYVDDLQLGGYTDWRIPLGSELASIYKTNQSFPLNATDWYWTSERFDRGYHRQALVVTTKKEKVFKRRQKDIKACGAVRAVRP